MNATTPNLAASLPEFCSWDDLPSGDTAVTFSVGGKPFSFETSNNGYFDGWIVTAVGGRLGGFLTYYSHRRGGTRLDSGDGSYVFRKHNPKSFVSPLAPVDFHSFTNSVLPGLI